MGDRQAVKPELVKFKENGLVPAIVQDQQTGHVLMLAYMNRESLQKTLESGRAWYWSRERQQLWMKGETSGNVQDVLGVTTDCDQDALLLRVNQHGEGACHEGDLSCFHYPLDGSSGAEKATRDDGDAVDGDAGRAGGVTARGGELEAGAMPGGAPQGAPVGARVLDELFQVVLDRKERPQEGSYTAYLFEQGLDKILKKVGEEASEVIIAAKGSSRPPANATPDPHGQAALTSEAADLVYHLLVLLADRGIPIGALFDELATRQSAPDAPPKPPKPSKVEPTTKAKSTRDTRKNGKSKTTKAPRARRAGE